VKTLHNAQNMMETNYFDTPQFYFAMPTF